METANELQTMTPSEVIQIASVRFYEPPLSTVWSDLDSVGETLRTTLLILNFDTETAMNGLVGFLHNSSGLYLPQTITAFDEIGAGQTAALLRGVTEVLSRYGVTVGNLRDNMSKLEEFQIVSIHEVHEDDLDEMVDEIDEIGNGLYLYKDDGEPIHGLLKQFVEINKSRLLTDYNGLLGALT